MKGFFKSVYLYLISTIAGCNYKLLYLTVIIFMIISISFTNFNSLPNILILSLFYLNISNMVFEIFSFESHHSCKILSTNQYSKSMKTSAIIFTNSAVWILLMSASAVLRFIISLVFNYDFYFTDIFLMFPIFSVINGLQIILYPYAGKKISVIILIAILINTFLVFSKYSPDFHLKILFSVALIASVLIFISGYLIETVLSVFLLNRYTKRQPGPQ